MGILDRIFGDRNKNKIENNTYLEMLNGYTPIFTSRSGGIYESELIRSVIHAKSKHRAKLKPQIIGGNYNTLESILQTQPNPFMTTYDFLYRLSTIYEVDTYAFIVPIYTDDYRHIVGLYPVKSSQVELLDYNGVIYLRYTFLNGKKAVIEYEMVGVISKYSYRNEFFGDGNGPLIPTLSLMHMQNQGIQEGIKQGAMIRFMAKIGRTISPDDLEKERKNFTSTNLASDNNTGVMIYDQKYEDVKQVESKPFIIDDKQMEFIKNNVYSYFGVNEDVLQNKYDENGWNAFFEGEVETFSLQLSLAITNIIFTYEEREKGDAAIFTSNRLQYASNKTKLEVSAQMFDRGIFGRDDIAEIWNMPTTGDNAKYIRREYAEVGKLITPLDSGKEENKEESTDDNIEDA